MSTNVYANTDRQRFVCTVEGCRRDYSRKDNLKLHVKQCHPEVCDEEEWQEHYKSGVSNCTQSFYHATQLIETPFFFIDDF